MYWVPDCHRCKENYNFPDVITQQQFPNEFDESLQQHGTSKKASDTGKKIITHNFVVPLKKCTQWEIWQHILQDTLVSIIVKIGVPLSYVIREVDAPNYAGHVTLEDNTIDTASLIDE